MAYRVFKLSLLFTSLSLLLAAASCTKSFNNPVNTGKIHLIINPVVDGNPLAFDALSYQNKAGNVYGITKLQFYLSNFRLYRQGQLCFTWNQAVYLDARVDSLMSFDIPLSTGIETGNYDSIALYIGLDPTLNVSNSLPATLQNAAMGWPDEMGGGYHFMKLEGYWLDSGFQSGFAVHLGSNGYYVNAGAKCGLHIPESANVTYKLYMNINQFFRDPYIYDFGTDGVFTMGNQTLMKKIAANGSDVFTSY